MPIDQSPYQDLRDDIDLIDGEIVLLLARRMQAAGKIMRLKKQAGVPPRDQIREREQVMQYTAMAQMHDVDVALVQQVFSLLHKAAVSEYPYDH